MDLENATALHTSSLLGTHTFRPGDVCQIEDHHAQPAPSGMRGVVYRVHESRITLALEERSASQNDEADFPPLVRLVKLANEATYARLDQTLAQLAESLGVPPPPSAEPATELASASTLTRVLLGLEPPTWAPTAPAWTPLHPRLNASQKEALSFALRANHFALLHGPPGTGKTTAMAELIVQLACLYPEARILVCGASNLAVDNLLERVVSTPEYREALQHARTSVTRIGHAARVLPALTGATLDVQSSESPEGQLVRDVAKEINELRAALSPPPTARAGNKSARKAPRPRGAERRQMWEQVRALRKEYRQRDQAVAGSVLRRARIVMATCHGAGSRALDQHMFDFVVIDEACQALELSCWTPILRLASHGRVFLSGDPQQLPPTVQSTPPSVAPGMGALPLPATLETTLFDRMLALYGSDCKALLSVQYRMNKEIMAFSNAHLYGGQLQAHESCAAIRLGDLGVDGDDDDAHGAPLVFYDTTGTGMYERTDTALLQRHSRLNENEAELVAQHIALLVERGVPPASIAVLSPYAAQVDMIDTQLRAVYGGHVEVGTVDGMQGREKDVVVLSLVRSNDAHDVGFLQDQRRLNVAMTRAKRQLVVIGDADTIGEVPAGKSGPARLFLRAWMEHLHMHALVEMVPT